MQFTEKCSRCGDIFVYVCVLAGRCTLWVIIGTPFFRLMHYNSVFVTEEDEMIGTVDDRVCLVSRTAIKGRS